MLSKRIIPCLDIDRDPEGRARVIKGTQFVDHRDAGDPIELAKFYQDEGADELVFYDISATHEGRGIMADIVAAVVEQVFMPLTVGGGIRTSDDAMRLIQAGAEKISINSAAIRRPGLIDEISRRFGACATVLGIDAKRVTQGDQVKWHVFLAGGRIDSQIEVLPWVRQAQSRGAGEIVLNVMDADGTRAGYDLEMTAAVSDALTIPVVASGGAGSAQHILEALTLGKADAALAASIFHFRETSVGAVKRFLDDNGVPVRIPPA